MDTPEMPNVQEPKPVKFVLTLGLAGFFSGLVLEAPLLGVVENMGAFVCPHCGQESRIFAGMSGEELASNLGIPFLGSVPLDPMVSLAGDRGTPSVIAYPERPQAEAFRAIAGQLAARSSVLAMERSGIEKPPTPV